MSQHLLLRVGDERFALALDRVVEALDTPPLHEPPRRPHGLMGTLRHRGRTLSVWDGARAFRTARREPVSTLLVLSDAGRHVALVVDDAEDVAEIASDALRAAPPGTDDEGLLEGVVRDANGLVSVVRTDVLVSRLIAWGGGKTE